MALGFALPEFPDTLCSKQGHTSQAPPPSRGTRRSLPSLGWHPTLESFPANLGSAASLGRVARNSSIAVCLRHSTRSFAAAQDDLARLSAARRRFPLARRGRVAGELLAQQFQGDLRIVIEVGPLAARDRIVD